MQDLNPGRNGDAPLGPSLSRSKRRFFTFVLFLGSVVTACALGELMVRVLGRGESGNATGGGGETLYQHDPLYGWKKRPGATIEVRTSEYEVSLAIDSLGLRGPETTREKPPGTWRVLLLGDSFLEGYTVDLEDLVSTRLEQFLSESRAGPVEVLNAGTAGYSTDQELLYFQGEGRTLHPDATVLLFYVNDVYFNTQKNYWRGEKPYYEMTDTGPALRGVPVPPPDPNRFAFEVQGGRGLFWLVRRVDAWLGTHSALHRMLRGTIVTSPLLSGLAIRMGMADVPREFKPWQRNPEPEVTAAWAITEALLVRLRNEVEQSGSEFHVFYVPSRPAVYDDVWRETRRAYAMKNEGWSPSADAEILELICRRNGINCVISLEAFLAESTRLERAGQSLYFQKDGHWTAEGHQLAARLIADALN